MRTLLSPLTFIDKLLAHDQPELLEDDSLSIDERFQIVEQLGIVMRRSGYHRRLIGLLNDLVDSTTIRQETRAISICDIGPGSGAMLRSIQQWADTQGIAVNLFGIDIDAEFGARAQAHLATQGIVATIHHGDATNLSMFADNHFDIVISSHVIHHIRSLDKVAQIFREVNRVTRFGFLIADLDRRVRGVPYMFAGLLFGGSRMLVIDGIRSIRRAYHRSQIQEVLRQNSARYRTQRMTVSHCKYSPYWWVTARKQSVPSRSR